MDKKMERKKVRGSVLLLLVSLLAVSLVFSLTNEVAYQPGQGHIGMTPISADITSAETFSVTVQASLPEAANTVQFKVTYPADKLQVTSVISLLPANWASDPPLKVVDFSRQGDISFLHAAFLGAPLAAGAHDLARVTFRVTGGEEGEPLLVRMTEASILTGAAEELVQGRIDGPFTYTLSAPRCKLGEELINKNICSLTQPKFCNNDQTVVDNCQQCGCSGQLVCHDDGSCRSAIQLPCDSIIRRNTKLEADVGSLADGCAGTGLTIGADNIVLDCNGFTIYGSGRHKGIDINRRNTVEIKNCRVVNFNRGISVEHSNHVTIRRSTVENNNEFGIHLRSSSLNTLIENTVTRNQQGMYLEAAADRNTVQKNTIVDNEFNGITVLSSLNNAFNENMVGKSERGDGNLFGFFIRLSHSNTFEDNVVENNRKHGFDLVQADTNTLESNVVRRNREAGIRLLASKFTSLLDNRVTHNEAGIQLQQSADDNGLEDNIVNSNRKKGIVMEGSVGNRLNHNVACDNGVLEAEGRFDLFCDDASQRTTGRENTFGEFDDETRQPAYVRTCNSWPRHSQDVSATEFTFCFLEAEDGDADGIRDEEDNCPLVYCRETLQLPEEEALNLCANPLQPDPDRDGLGDPCDGDNDNDRLPDNTEPLACRTTGNGPQKAQQQLVQEGVCDLTRENCSGCLIGDFTGAAGDRPDGCVNNGDVQFMVTRGTELLDRLGVRGMSSLLFAFRANYDRTCVPAVVP